jgi:O-antigen/teichoic acid export membrane protein
MAAAADQRVGRPVPTRGASGAEFVRDVLPIGAGIVLSALYFRIDVLLIQRWNGIEAVALYNAVFRLVEALRLFPAAVLAVALPMLVGATSSRPAARMSALVTLASIGVSAVLWLTAGELVPLLYGEPYAAAVPAFRILLMAFPLMSLNYVLTHQLIGWNGHHAYAMLCGLALGVNVGLNAWLLPSTGITGAAWATLWTEAVITAGCLVSLRARRAHAAARFDQGLDGDAAHAGSPVNRLVVQ